MGSSERLNPVEQLIIMQSAYEEIGKEVSTKGTGLRYDVDSHYRNIYEETGAKSFEVDLLGDNVGTISMKFSKPKPETTVQEFKVTDYIALCEKLSKLHESYDMEIMRKFVEKQADVFAQYYFDETGECLPGCEVVTEVKPAEPRQYIGTTLRIDKSKVAEICERSLLTNVTKLLLGASDE